MFYHNEVFQSNIQDTNPMRSVIGRCAVMTLRDYCRCECQVCSARPSSPDLDPWQCALDALARTLAEFCQSCTGTAYSWSHLPAFPSGRPTEVFEDDVFVCENKYNERDKEIRRLKGLKVRGRGRQPCTGLGCADPSVACSDKCVSSY